MRILMSGSGSGGHIYPCIGLYNNLKVDNEIIIICFKKIDKKIYDLNNIKYFYIDDNLPNRIKLREINKIFKNTKIDKVITFGGKNSIFIQLISKYHKIDSYIFEQNIILGKANKLNSLFANKIFTNFKIDIKKEVNVGNPNALLIKPKQIKMFSNNRITLLFTMGSLGSSTVNKIIEKYINNNDKYNIIYVSGNNVYTNITSNSFTKVYNYYNPLTDLINASDIIITRAGASTLSEIINLNKPMIIIPSPYVANNHQVKNAKYLYKHNCCEIIYEKDLSLNELSYLIDKLSHDKKYYMEMKENTKKMMKYNTFETIRKSLNI